MLNNHTEYKYETPYKGPFVITHCFISGTVMLKCVVIQIMYNICRISTYKLDNKVEYFNSINMYDDVKI